MKNKRPLVPGILNKLDDYLLKNRPDTWSARTHFVVYYGLLFAIVLTAVCFLLPDDPRTSSSVYVSGFLTGVLSFIGFIVWLIYLLRFNVFKRFGIVTPGDKIKTFLLYFIAVAVLAGVIYIPAFVEKTRANAAYGNTEIVQDVNDMNLDICSLNYDSLPRKWDDDTVLVRNEKRGYITYDERGRPEIQGHQSGFYIIDTAEFQSRKMEADSVTKINDSIFVFYKCPDYSFINADRFDYSVRSDFGRRANYHTLNSAEIFNKVFKSRETFNKADVQQQLKRLLHKYNAKDSSDAYADLDYSNGNSSYMARISSQYHLSSVNRSLYNISNRKFGWRSATGPSFFLRMLYYPTLMLTLLVFIFRHSTVKTFFLSVLTGILLMILSGLFMAFAAAGQSAILITYLVYIIIFLGIAFFSARYSKIRNAIAGIALNLALCFIVFVPLLMTMLYYQLQKNADRLNAIEMPGLNKYKNEDTHYFYAELIGCMLLLVLIEILFKKLYRKWYALPEA